MGHIATGSRDTSLASQSTSSKRSRTTNLTEQLEVRQHVVRSSRYKVVLVAWCISLQPSAGKAPVTQIGDEGVFVDAPLP